MSGQIVTIHGEQAYQAGVPDPDVVSEIERWLEAAKAGEVQGVAIAVHWRDGSSGGRRAGAASRAMVGELFALAQQCTSVVDE